MLGADLVGALELGGSHVTGAVVDLRRLAVVDGPPCRRALEGDLGPDGLVATLAAVATDLAVDGLRRWALAVPGPFDYERGIALFEQVGKFDALHGLDLRAALAAALAAAPEEIVFTNDADAFLVGSWAAGLVTGHARCAALTLGTGIGSAFAVDGRPVREQDCVIPGGRAHLLRVGGQPLEDVVSTRAIIAGYHGATGRSVSGVRDVAELARHGDPASTRVLGDALGALGSTMRPYLDGFGATALVVGGSMVQAWDVVEPPLRRGLEASGVAHDLVLVPAPGTETLSLLGAAVALT